MKYTIFKTKWGYFGIAGNKSGLVGTCLPTTKERVKLLLLKDLKAAEYDKTFFCELAEQITAYFEGNYVNFSRDIPAAPGDFSEFGIAVLNACRDIGFGETRTYGQLAEKIGRGDAVRAVGGILARNPLPLIIPCHRVICSNGELGGFSAFGGVTVKKNMLELEKTSIKRVRA